MTVTPHLAEPASVPLGAAADSPAAVRIHELRLRDFRNIECADLVFPAGGVAIIGDNGHGKTNLLEAIYYLQLLRSMRGASDHDVVRFGAGAFHVGATLAENGAGALAVAVGFECRGKRKKVVLDGVETGRLSDALGALPSVIVSPRDVELVAGGPGARRRFLDVMLAVTSRSYLGALQRYRAALARRNAVLRALARGGVAGARADARVAPWDEPLAQSGAIIRVERQAWVDGVATAFSRVCKDIGERGPVRMRYVSSQEPGSDPASALLAALEARRPIEIRRGMTLAGPHRDDLDVQLDERELRTFGSAGQQRTSAIALRLLETVTLRDRTGAEPLLMLDDPFAELDAQRAHRILGVLSDHRHGQTILAVPRAGDIPRELTRLEHWRMHDGVVAA